MPRLQLVFRLLAALALIAFAAGSALAQTPATAAAPEEAKRVGGDFIVYGEKLAVLRDANARVWKASRTVVGELGATWRRISEAPSTRGFWPQVGFIVASFVIFLLALRAACRQARRSG